MGTGVRGVDREHGGSGRLTRTPPVTSGTLGTKDEQDWSSDPKRGTFARPRSIYTERKEDYLGNYYRQSCMSSHVAGLCVKSSAYTDDEAAWESLLLFKHFF